MKQGSKPVHWENPKDGVGREVGVGSGWGTHVLPWLIHVNVWQNHHSIVISLQLNKFKRMLKNFFHEESRIPEASFPTSSRTCGRGEVVFRNGGLCGDTGRTGGWG